MTTPNRVGMMNLKQLRYFIAIADCGSMSAAANKVRIAQSAISSQVALLEEELATKLILRHSRGAHFTAAGEVFIEHARSIVAAFERARVAVHEAALQKCGQIRLGLPSGISINLTVPLVELMADTAPKVELHILEGLNSDVKGWFENNELDIAVLYQTDKQIPKGALPFVEDDLVLAGPPIDGIARGAVVPFSTLAKIPLAFTSRSHGVRSLVDGIARKMSIPLHYSAEIDSTFQLKEMVLHGKYHAILPRSLFGGAQAPPHIEMYTVSDPTLAIRSFIITNPRGASALTNEIAKSLKKFVEMRVVNGDWPGGRLYRF
jgi:LysR family nitrogen assimilation transcriptional regulator